MLGLLMEEWTNGLIDYRNTSDGYHLDSDNFINLSKVLKKILCLKEQNNIFRRKVRTLQSPNLILSSKALLLISRQ